MTTAEHFMLYVIMMCAMSSCVDQSTTARAVVEIRDTLSRTHALPASNEPPPIRTP